MKTYKPYTPSRRQTTTVDYSALSKVRPMKSATRGIKKRAGRNSQGRITVRHQGGGAKGVLRLVDFKQNKLSTNKYAIIFSKKLRNVVAGYMTRLKRKES